MRMKTWMRRASIVLPAVVATVLLGCSDLLGTEQELALNPFERLDPGIHPVLVTAENGTEARVELHLKRVDVDDKVASYQGELTYDAETLVLSGGEIPSGITGAWNEVEKGKVRFAGVSLGGIEEGAVLTLTFTAQRALDASDFELKMEEIVAVEGFQNLTTRVNQRSAQPLFSRSPLP
jgi:hypothetical protein